MAEDKLFDYIKQQMDAGYSVSGIETVLRQSGYNDKDIDKAIDKALMRNKDVDMKKSHKGLWITIVIVILLLVGGAGAYFVLFNPTVPAVVNPDPIIKEPVVDPEPIVEEPVMNETEIVDEPIEVSPNVWIEAPQANATYEEPLLLPSKAFDFNQNDTVSITMKVYVTEYVQDLRPNITCDQIGDELIVTYPYEEEAIVGEQAYVTFVLKATNRILFSDCTIDFPTTDLRSMQSSFAVTIT